MAFEHILFDLDGTLTNTYEGVSKSVAYGLSRLGIKEDNPDVLKKFIGPPLLESFTSIYGLSEEKAKLAISYYRERYNEKGVYECSLIEGVEPTLKLLSERGKKIYLATSKPLHFAKIVLDYFDITKYFDFLGGADLKFGRDEKWQVIDYVFENADIKDKSTAVLVGDRKYDIIGAKKTGISSIGVLCGFGTRQELTEYGADFIAEKFSDITDYIL